jgi:cholesterol oxidase
MGPVITSAVRVPDAVDGGEGRGFYIQDAGYPEFANWLLQGIEMPGETWRARAALRPVLSKLLLRRPDTGLSDEISALFGKARLSGGILPMLGIGRDIADGRMRLRDGMLDIDWRKRGRSAQYFKRLRGTMRALAEEMGARFLDDPLWHVNRVITVHPLGGCPMGRDIHEGVVDAYGRSFAYKDLIIADGSVMPGPVGTNPSLTIAALADRFADRLIDDLAEERR